jgi:hypothetical protein
MRETVEVIREIFRGGKIDYQGRHVQIPLPNGDALPMRTSLEIGLSAVNRAQWRHYVGPGNVWSGTRLRAAPSGVVRDVLSRWRAGVT